MACQQHTASTRRTILLYLECRLVRVCERREMHRALPRRILELASKNRPRAFDSDPHRAFGDGIWPKRYVGRCLERCPRIRMGVRRARVM